MGWLRSFRLHRAAKAYARRLPRALAEGWGASRRYTRGQIDAAVVKAGLDRAFVAIGYGAYLTREEFEQVRNEAAMPLAYDEARALFERQVPLSSAWAPASVSAYALDKEP